MHTDRLFGPFGRGPALYAVFALLAAVALVAMS